MTPNACTDVFGIVTSILLVYNIYYPIAYTPSIAPHFFVLYLITAIAPNILNHCRENQKDIYSNSLVQCLIEAKRNNLN